jgi:hypothetical protein
MPADYGQGWDTTHNQEAPAAIHRGLVVSARPNGKASGDPSGAATHSSAEFGHLLRY